MSPSFDFVPCQISKVREARARSIALSHSGRHMTFEELDRGASRFAGYLQRLGVGPGDTVAVCMERSFEWVVAALGTMRAGAAYAPLEPSWPDARLRFAVQDSGAKVLVAPSGLFQRLAVNVRGIDCVEQANAIAAGPEVSATAIGPETLAYVIYTSGTTGVPKGVEITHANLLHLVRWHLDTFGVTHNDRASHLAGLGFDAAVWEIWPNLAAGATVCIADEAVRSSPELTQQWMIREGVTIGFVPTVHAVAMMTMRWPRDTQLRFLLTGGDALRQAPDGGLPFTVVNNYGPTECTVVATSCVVTPESGGAPPIGLPIDRARIHLLDEEGEPAPDGTVGEICIGGSGVGRGYRNLPGATERSFLPDPFDKTPGARMYRTGDRGLRRADGQIEFCGRLDRQIKVRGQRVELDEIGNVLAAHPSIEFATATAGCTGNSRNGENQLAAYFLPRAGASIPTAQELQRHLLLRLPDYMIPAIFVQLNSLPVTPNGKLDLNALVQGTLMAPIEPLNATGLQSPIEQKLLRMVQEVLENQAVSAEDSFLLAGGHSLLGMQLLVRLRNEFGVKLTLQQLFEAPTVRSLAQLVVSTIAEDIDGMSNEEAEAHLFGDKRQTIVTGLAERRGPSDPAMGPNVDLSGTACR